ncbi:YihY/virulence factor BrkB family protein [Xylophilus ampelinus]|uniref:Membrane protein n=1 Tax=Xylophilus ampelinus TaxID=54067 RepID=A0A318SGZ2_9BURK|nr:YihY/virulence factor BrkB family protein [Xylophilus ampelinus]MCS4510275.1 YihY/virulence factor BrkB family protein [Xylophilus ampelinus]PYE78104.1 membrane protein [Xylophilus ampelinus]
MKPSTIFDIAKKSALAWVDDYAPSMGAAISYYTVFSIAPLLVILIAIAGYVFGEEAVRGSLQGQISGLVGEDGAEAIQGLISSAREPAEGLVASGISIVFLLLGATTVFAEIQSALDRIWHVPEKAKPSGLWGLLRARFLSFGLILGLAFLMMASLSISAGLAAIDTYFQSLMPGWTAVLMLLNLALSLSVETLLFAMIFKLMPSTRIAWRDVWVGAAVTAVLFELGKVLIGLYVGKAGISSTYAAAGSIAVILIWVYYATQVFLLGAEFTKVYASEHGSYRNAPLVPPQEDAAPRKSGTATERGSAPASSERLEIVRRDAHQAGVPVATSMAIKGGLLIVRLVLTTWLNRRKGRSRGRRS